MTPTQSLAQTALTLRFELAELPSAQHRAGLAGMWLIIDWLKRLGPHQGVVEAHVDAAGMTLTIDEAGLGALLDLVYDATWSEVEVTTPWKETEPLRTETRREPDPKTGRVKVKRVFVYPRVFPRGAFLASVESDSAHPWLNLWQEFIWQVMRGKPKSRLPYHARAQGEPCGLSDKTWKGLAKAAAGQLVNTNLAGSLYLGAQDRTGDNVEYLDRQLWQFLLHAWVYAASLYQVVGLANDGKRNYQGFAVAIPDVADLEAFCEHYLEFLKNRPPELAGRFPRAAVADLPAEAALDTAWKLRTTLQRRAASASLEELVWGIEVVHAAKDGNNIRLHQVFRLTPNVEAERLCQDLRGKVHHALVRQLRLTNLIAQRPWYAGFDRLFETRPLKITFEDGFFRLAIRELLAMEAADESRRERTPMIDPPTPGAPKPQEPYVAERTVLRVVRAYVQRKLESKYGLKWKDVQTDESKKPEYQEARYKIAKEAFLAVRSRNDMDFVEYFATTLCSVPQFLPEEEFVQLSRELYLDPSKIRTFTLMALSAAQG